MFDFSMHVLTLCYFYYSLITSTTTGPEVVDGMADVGCEIAVRWEMFRVNTLKDSFEGYQWFI